MGITEKEVAQFTELNELLSQGEMKDQPKTPEFLGGLVANRCYQDEAFAKAFRADPDGTVRALASDIGIQLPASLKIVSCENDETVWNLPAPSQARLANLRSSNLSDEQMSQVSGGELIIAAITMGVLGAKGELPHQKRKKGKK